MRVQRLCSWIVINICIYRMAASRPPSLSIAHAEETYNPFSTPYEHLYIRNENPRFSPGEYYTDDELNKLLEDNVDNFNHHNFNGEQIIHLLRNIITKRLTPVQIEHLPADIKEYFFGYTEIIPFGFPTEHPAVAAGIRTPTPPSSPVEDTSGKRKRRKRTIKNKNTKKSVRKRVRKTRKTKGKKRTRRRRRN